MKNILLVLYLAMTWVGIVMVAARYEQLNQTLKEVIEHQKRFERIWIEESRQVLSD